MPDPPELERHRFVHQRLLGTVVEVVVAGCDRDDAAAIDSEIVAEMTRLESVFSIFDPASTLCRWRSGEIEEPGTELAHLLTLALDWQERSGGVFNPLAGELTALWRSAEQDGHDPSPDLLSTAARSITAPRYVAEADGAIRRVGDCGGLDLNAIAKGHVVDLAVAVARPSGTHIDLTVSAGGDLVHRGGRPRVIGIENPLRPYDNEPPLTTIEIADVAVAGSGSGRRGITVAGRRRNHVLDPRSGWPADAAAGAVVVAPDAATADVVATVVSALAPAEAIPWLDGLPDVAGLVVAADGHVCVDRAWMERFGAPPPAARRRGG